MKVYRITEAELESIVQQWKKSCMVFQPSEEKNQSQGGCAPGWLPVDDSINLPATGPSKTSVKTFFFPQPELLHTYSLKKSDADNGLLKEAQVLTDKQVVFGVRPCDARSIVLNNLPYKEDPLYQANMNRTVLVGFTCSTALSSCFCDQVGGSPLDTEGLDIALSRAGDALLMEVITDKGAELVQDCDLSPADNEVIASLAARRNDKKTDDAGQLDNLKAKELNTLYDAPLWKPLGESCINCGACTFLCPTCYCFDIQDEVIQGKGRRIRLWDSCMFPLYSLHTSGHNPRGKKVQRVRNRFLHKLKYFPDRFGPFSCVGCGRCVQECPVNIDIREVMDDLLAVE